MRSRKRQNWKRRHREASRSIWSRRRRGAVCQQGIFQLTLLELRRRGNAVKKIPSAQKLEKFWVLEKKVLDPAQTGRPQMKFQCWQIRAKHWKRPHSGGRRRSTGRPQPWKLPFRTALAVSVLEARSRSWRQSAAAAFVLLIVGQLHLIKQIEHQA